MKDVFEWWEFFGPAKAVSSDETQSRLRLERSQAMTVGLFEACPIGLFSLDNDSGRFLAANRAFSRISGYSADELRELPFTHVVAPEDVARVSDYRARRMKGDPTLPESYEMLIKAKSGEHKVVLFHANVLKFSDAIFGAIQDITHEKLLMEPLLHAQRMDGLALLAGGLANEFNNLMAAVSGYAELAMSEIGKDQPRLSRTMVKIQDAVDEAIRHVRALLSFARRGTNALASVDLEELVAGVVAVVPSLARRMTCNIRVEGFDTLGTVRGDGSQLEQALLNIVVNAVEALEEPQGTVSIRGHHFQAGEGNEEGLLPGRYAAIEVTDDGRGIPAVNLGRVPQPFFTTKEPERHPGLGLSTAYGIVRDHGGSLTLSSRLGEGTTVRMALPLDLDPAQLVPAPLDSAQTDPAREESILVVDDQEYVAELFCDILEQHGFEACYETAARVALEKLDAGDISPTLLVVDLMMPDMDGRTFVRRVRARDAHIPVIVTSGFSHPDERDAELVGATDGFLRKPFKHTELLDLIHRVRAARAVQPDTSDDSLPPAEDPTRGH